jgi:hypothetical protein
MTYPSFVQGEKFRSTDANAIGLWLIKTQTIGTAVSSVTVTSAFNSSFDNYRIIVNGGSTSSTNNLALTLGATATGYYDAGIYIAIGTGSVLGYTNSNAASFISVAYGSANNIHGAIELHDPFNAKNTTMEARAITALTTGTCNSASGYLANTTSYTDFTLTCSLGTMTGGTIRVYGYTKG